MGVPQRLKIIIDGQLAVFEVLSPRRFFGGNDLLELGRSRLSKHVEIKVGVDRHISLTAANWCQTGIFRPRDQYVCFTQPPVTKDPISMAPALLGLAGAREKSVRLQKPCEWAKEHVEVGIP